MVSQAVFMEAGCRNGKDIAIGTIDFGFDFRAGQIGRSVSWPPLQRIFGFQICVAQALNRGE